LLCFRRLLARLPCCRITLPLVFHLSLPFRFGFALCFLL